MKRLSEILEKINKEQKLRLNISTRSSKQSSFKTEDDFNKKVIDFINRNES